MRRLLPDIFKATLGAEDDSVTFDKAFADCLPHSARQPTAKKPLQLGFGEHGASNSDICFVRDTRSGVFKGDGGFDASLDECVVLADQAQFFSKKRPETPDEQRIGAMCLLSTLRHAGGRVVTTMQFSCGEDANTCATWHSIAKMGVTMSEQQQQQQKQQQQKR
jgi:hypothetical protein